MAPPSHPDLAPFLPWPASEPPVSAAASPCWRLSAVAPRLLSHGRAKPRLDLRPQPKPPPWPASPTASTAARLTGLSLGLPGDHLSTSRPAPPPFASSSPVSRRPAVSGGELFFNFTKRMTELVDAEEAAVTTSEPAMADHFTRVLKLARGRRLPVSKLAALCGPVGLLNDSLLRVLSAYTDLFHLPDDSLLVQAGSSQATALQSPWPR